MRVQNSMISHPGVIKSAFLSLMAFSQSPNKQAYLVYTTEDIGRRTYVTYYSDQMYIPFRLRLPFLYPSATMFRFTHTSTIISYSLTKLSNPLNVLAHYSLYLAQNIIFLYYLEIQRSYYSYLLTMLKASL